MEYQTLVTKQDYLYFAGVDLDLELTSRIINDVGDNPAPRFIFGIEEWCKMQFKKPPYFYKFNTDSLTTHQYECFKMGVMHQIQYVLRNGNVSNDSGFNTATGMLVPRSELEKIGMSMDAKGYFRSAGFMNIWRY